MLYAMIALAATAMTPTARAEPTPAAQPQDAAPVPPAKPTNYCVVRPPITGSLLRVRTCHTRAEWLKRGFDPLAPDQ